MPTINSPIKDLLPSVDIPVIYDVIRQLMRITGISPKTIIRFPGEDAKMKQWNSQTIGALSGALNIWPHLDNVRIEVEEDFNPDRILNMAVKAPENPYLFVDRELNVLLNAVYSPTNVTINVIYEGVDKNEAMRWRNDVRTRMAQGREINLHTLKYSYGLPPEFEALLMHIYDLRSNVGSYSDNIEDWWYKCASPKFTVSTDQAGNHATIVVAEQQSMVQGVFDWEMPEKMRKSTDADMWEVSFAYKFTFDKPIEINAKYPMLVHQQLIGDVFRQYNNFKPYEDILRELQLSGKYLSQFQGDRQIVNSLANKGVTLPIEDDWQPLPKTVPTGTVRVFTALVSISEADKRSLLDLKNLGQFQLVPLLLDFMAAGEYPYMTQHMASILQLTLFEGYDVLDPADFQVNSDLTITATRDLDVRKMYHVRLALNANILSLMPGALSRIKAFGGNLASVLAQALNGALGESGRDPDLKKNALNAYDLGRLGLQGGMLPPSYSYSLFQTLFVVAKRLDEYQPSGANPHAIDHPFVAV